MSGSFPPAKVLLAAMMLILLPALVAVRDLPTMTPEDLAKYDGMDGRPAYVALNGLVYDVSQASRWYEGQHFACDNAVAGRDITELWRDAPGSHFSAEFLAQYPVVGRLAAGKPQVKVSNPAPATRPAPAGRPLLSREQALSLGWLAVFSAVLSVCSLRMKKALTGAIQPGAPERNRSLARQLKAADKSHCRLAFVPAVLVLLHTWDKLTQFRLAASYVALVAFHALVLSGIIRSHYRKSRLPTLAARYLHLASLGVLVLSLAYHIYDKLFP